MNENFSWIPTSLKHANKENIFFSIHKSDHFLLEIEEVSARVQLRLNKLCHSKGDKNVLKTTFIIKLSILNVSDHPGTKFVVLEFVSVKKIGIPESISVIPLLLLFNLIMLTKIEILKLEKFCNVKSMTWAFFSQKIRFFWSSVSKSSLEPFSHDFVSLLTSRYAVKWRDRRPSCCWGAPPPPPPASCVATKRGMGPPFHSFFIPSFL